MSRAGSGTASAGRWRHWCGHRGAAGRGSAGRQTGAGRIGRKVGGRSRGAHAARRATRSARPCKFDPDRSPVADPRPHVRRVAGRTLPQVGRRLVDAGRRQGPDDAPNVLIVLIDDAGFGSRTPSAVRSRRRRYGPLADNGLTYNRFHVTAVCSPTRAALLTGRNHHRCGFSSIASIPDRTRLLPRHCRAASPRCRGSCGTTVMSQGIRQVASTPDNVQGAAGPFDRWPQGWGFDHWWGFLSGAAGQVRPIITRDNGVIGGSRSQGGQAVLLPG